MVAKCCFWVAFSQETFDCFLIGTLVLAESVDAPCPNDSASVTAGQSDGVLSPSSVTVWLPSSWFWVLKTLLLDYHGNGNIKFLESASSVYMEDTTSRKRPISHSKTNKYKLPMAGAILLNARCQSMPAHMYRNAMAMHHGGAKRFSKIKSIGCLHIWW